MALSTKFLQVLFCFLQCVPFMHKPLVQISSCAFPAVDCVSTLWNGGNERVLHAARF